MLINMWNRRLEKMEQLRKINEKINEILSTDPRKKQFPWMFDENGKMKGKR